MRLCSILITAVGLALSAASLPAAAQNLGTTPFPVDASLVPAPAGSLPLTPQHGSVFTPGQLGLTGHTPTRIIRTDREMNRVHGGVDVGDPLPSDRAAIIENAQSALKRIGADCAVTDAIVIGRDLENAVIYEAACASSIGYMVTSGFPVLAVHCTMLATSAPEGHRDPAADVVSECTLPGNQITAASVAAYAREAGVDCDIDAAGPVGMGVAGPTIEVGCRGEDGYWLTLEQDQWRRISCLKVLGQAGDCQFTSNDEQAVSLTRLVSGTVADGCEVREAVYVGTNGERDYFEARCGSGDGYMLELGADQTVSNAWDCERASRIAGGCQLTAVEPRG